MDYFIGVDIGTTSAKAIAFENKGKVISDCSISYKMAHPEAGFSEQDPDEILQAVVSCINSVLKVLTPDVPRFVSFSAAMHSIIAISKDGTLLTPCIIWADNRADEIAKKLRETKEGKNFYKRSGVPVHSMSPLCKLLWLREQKPEIFQAAYKFIGIKEFIFYRFFNRFVVDSSIASSTGLLNIKTLQWDTAILNFVGITEDQLSTVVTPKAVFHYRDFFKGLSTLMNTPFVIGASDGALSNLATGAAPSSTLTITIGTSGAVRVVTTKAKTDRMMRTFCYHLKDQLYICGGANNNGAIVLQWLRDNLLETKETFEELFKRAELVEPGSKGLIFLPYLLGERAPLWNANAEGVYFGLTINHTKSEIIRATIEAVIYSVYSIAKILEEKNEIKEISATGGFAKSSTWLQILSDVSNRKVIASDIIESSAVGAVILGAEATNFEIDFKNIKKSTYYPNKGNHTIYQQQFKKFQRLYKILKAEMMINK